MFSDLVEIAVIRRRIAGDVWVGLSWIGLTDADRTHEDWAWFTDEDTEPPAWAPDLELGPTRTRRRD